MRFEAVAEGWVAGGQLSDESAIIAVGPRIVALPQGRLLCSFMRQSAIGVNDFIPFVARSDDSGESWHVPEPVWPGLAGRWSVFVSLSRDASGNLFLFGSRTPIDRPGETFWSNETQGLKPNELIWAESIDSGGRWLDPRPIVSPTPGSFEAAGPMCVTRAGRWLAVYSPYNSFDPQLSVPRNQVVILRSDDKGHSWSHVAMLRFPRADAGGAEAWVAELDDRRLLGTAWNVDLSGQTQYPNAFSLSHDGGETWSETRSTGVLGQSTALFPAGNGQVLFVYNQRRSADPGVWLAVARPTEVDFGVEHQQIVWKASAATQKGTSGTHDEWTDFAFGEPSIVVLSNGDLLLVLWCIQPEGSGIRYVRLRRLS